MLGIDLRKYNREYLPIGKYCKLYKNLYKLCKYINIFSIKFIVNNKSNNEDVLSNKNENLHHPIPNGISTEVQPNIEDHKAEEEKNKNLSAEETRGQMHNLEDSIEIERAGTSNSDTQEKLKEILKKYLVCDICDKSFKYVTDLTRHILNHPKKIFICDYCGYKTIYRVNIQRHINGKHTKQTFYNCSYCKFKTAYKECLNIHINVKHTKQIFYNCSYCKFKTGYKPYLNTHINSKHYKKNVYECSFCEYKSYYQTTFKNHINAKHTKTQCYGCNYCNLTSYYSSTLRSHIKNIHKKQN